MPRDARLDAWARLALAGLGIRSLATLLRTLGSAQAVVAARPAQLAKLIPADDIARLGSAPDREREARLDAWLEEPGHSLLAWDDPDYPQSLLQIADPPPVLFHLGRRDLTNRLSIAVVGSRRATPQGSEDAQAFARTFSQAGLAVVSGLALGIDAAAHRGGLEGPGSTLAVIGTGPDRVYPARNRDLAHRIGAQGAILSEYAPGTPPLPPNFPRRNRLISGLSRGVLVVEATMSSGSLITARMAADQGREVFAVPGSIHSPFSRGCHKLIREGAKLVETAQDVLDELRLGAPGVAAGQRAVEATPVAADPVTATILDAMGRSPVDLDRLVARTGLAAEAIAASLVGLELAGGVATLPGGRWQRIG